MQTLQVNNSLCFPIQHSQDSGQERGNATTSSTIIAVTIPYRDSEDRIVQLWLFKGKLFGGVLDTAKRLTIVPAERIINPLQAGEPSSDLACRLSTRMGSKWDLVFNVSRSTITIWPHLIAAGKDGPSNPVRFGLPICGASRSQIEALFLKKGFQQDSKNPDVWYRYGKDGTLRTKYHFDAGGGNHSHKHIDINHSGEHFQFIRQCRLSRLKEDLAKGKINQEQYQYLKKGEYKQRVAYDVKRPGNGGGGNRPPTGVKGGSPGAARFAQTTQQTRLTADYNSTNKHQPVPARGGPAGDIGGVACSIDYIQGLFDGPGALTQPQHLFYLPTEDGIPPFSDAEFRQIVRELAIGIYVHSSVPFFSLHFNQDGELFPVIHPAYENTLVGRVIALLDYTMKGYLNGGIFHDGFVDSWASNPNWSTKGATALSQLIDFSEYCQHHLQGADTLYLSVRELQALHTIKESAAADEPEIFSDHTQFSNSFRIISKQNGFQQHDNILVINSDFDVFYTINPSAKYKAALEHYYREHGQYPDSYVKLQRVYEESRMRIHDHFTKFPLRKQYFAMLGVIGYFSSYFSTLKKHRKVPVLSPLKIDPQTITPALFPHLPTKVKEKIDLIVNIRRLFQTFSSAEKAAVLRFRDEYIHPGSYPEAEKQLREILKTKAIAEFERHLNGSKKAAFRKSIARTEILGCVNGVVVQVLALIKHCQDDLQQALDLGKNTEQQLVDRTIVITPEELAGIEMVRKLKAELPAKKAELQRTLASYPRHEWNQIVDLTAAAKADINSKIQKIDEGLSKLPDDPLEEYYRKRLENVRKAIQEIESKMQHLSEAVLEILKDKDLEMASFDALVLSLKEDMSLTNRLAGQRLVGGCGFALKVDRVVPSLQAEKIQVNHLSSLVSLPEETWQVLADETSRGAVVALKYEGVPPWVDDDYRWMEGLLHEEGKEFWSNWQKAQICLAKDQPNELLQLLQEAPSLLKERDFQGRSLLHLAALSANPSIVRALLHKGFSTHEADRQGYLPLHYAAMKETCDNLLPLLEADPTRKTVHVASTGGDTPLMVAVQHKRTPQVTALVTQGAKNVSLTTGYNTLHCALHQGSEEIARLLLDRKVVGIAEVNALAEEGGTPLMMACELRMLNLVQLLCAAGAQINQERKDGVTAMEIAIQLDDLPTLEFLLTQGYPCGHALEAAARGGSLQVCRVLAKKALLFYGHRNSQGETLVHIAIRHGNIAPFMPLINDMPPSDLVAINRIGESVVTLAVRGGYWELLDLLAKKGVLQLSFQDIQVLVRHPYHPTLKNLLQNVSLTPDEWNLLMNQAAVSGNTQAISSILIEKGGRLDAIRGPNQWTAIHYLVKFDAIYLLRRYYGSGLELVNQINLLIEIAASHGSVKCLKYLADKIKTTPFVFNPQWIRAAIGSFELEALKIVLSLAPDPKAAVSDPNIAPPHLAASFGCKDMVKYLLSLKVNANMPDAKGHSALFYAIKAGSIETVLYLIKKGRAVVGAHELFKAACSPNPKMFGLVCSAAPSIEAVTDKGNTALMLAVSVNRQVAVERLLKAGANMTRRGQNNWTPTCLAASNGHTEVLRTLLGHTVDPSTVQDKNPLHWACEKGYPDAVRLLLRYNFTADQKAIALATPYIGVLYELGRATQQVVAAMKAFEDGLETVSPFATPDLKQLMISLQRLPLNERIAYENGAATPLQCLLKKLNEVKNGPLPAPWLAQFEQELVDREIPRLISSGLDPNVSDSHGNTLAHHFLKLNLNPCSLQGIRLLTPNNRGVTPLHVAAQHAEPAVFNAILPLIKGNINTEDKEGRTPIFYTLENKFPSHVAQLVACGAHVDHRDFMNRTVLLIAIAQDKLAFVQVLASQGASLNQKVEGTKITPLHAAVGNGNVEVTRFLLDCGADVKQANKQKELPLHYAAQEGHSTIFRLLAEHGSPLESPTKKGIRPAHLAAKGGHVDILRQLHGRGASLNISAKENQSEDASVPETPLHFAAATGQQEAVQFLLSRCVKLKEDARNDRSILDVSADSASVLESLRVYRLTENPELLCQAALFALKHDNPSTLRILMSWGITPNTDLGMGQFLLHWAARFGAVQCTAFLLVQGADPFLTDAEGQTPLEVAAANNSSEQFEQLLEFCRYLPEFDIDRVNSRGETLVHIAAKAGNLPHLCSLTWYGASLSLQNVQLSTPLDLLLFHVSEQTDPVLNMKWVQAAKFLFVCGGEISQAKENHPLLTSFYAAQQPGDSPLHLAVRLQVSHAIELLVALLDVNTQNDKGMSSLHVAAEQGYLSGAVALLKAGADVKLHDAQGRIPVHLSSHDATVRLLKSHKGA